jgi:hypothetical protein
MTKPHLFPALVAAAILFVTSSPATRAAEMFPFVLPWDDASTGATNVSAWLDKPAGEAGFVAARDGHLFAGPKRVRFFGVNLAFGGNFPTHADAEKVAARMAKFGINCVRFHHMDTSTAPGGLLQKDKHTFDPESLDRLDYFVAQLKKNGIYGNLNLHVGLEYPGFQKWEGASGYFKGVDNFFPPMIEQQREYARTLLTHVNPFTGKAYVDEPAIAFIEINNENGLIMEWNGGTLDAMPDPFAAEFQKQWNAWLMKKYGDHAKLAAVWNEGAEPLGAEMLKPGHDAWYFEVHGEAKATHDFSAAEASAGRAGGPRFCGRQNLYDQPPSEVRQTAQDHVGPEPGARAVEIAGQPRSEPHGRVAGNSSFCAGRRGGGEGAAFDQQPRERGG